MKLTSTPIAQASSNGTIRKAVVEGHKLGNSANEFGRVWSPTVETMIPVSQPLTKEGPIDTLLHYLLETQLQCHLNKLQVK